ncbi:MAG: hypothetical protein OXI59_17090 [Gemmatimonadota bacterium]|nr:hypothetical protein [Gemmatimonadota bacterium]
MDAEVVTRIYIDSWNAGFGELIEQSNRIVTSELVERWRGDLAKSAPHRWWVAEHTGKVVGFVGIGPSRDPVDATLGNSIPSPLTPRIGASASARRWPRSRFVISLPTVIMKR